MKISVNGVTLAYDRYGPAEGTPLFHIHGFGDCRFHMAHLARRLSPTRPVICYDCRGHGESSRPERYTLSDHGRDLLAFLDALNLPEADALGYSMGSYIAGQTAVLDGRRIRRLILLCSKAAAGDEGSSLEAYFRRLGLDEAARQDKELVRAALARAVWSPKTGPARREAISRCLAELRRRPDYVPMRPEDRARAAESLRGFDLREGYRALRCPTLVVSARDDGFNPVPRSEEIAALIPGSRYHCLEGAAHNVIYEREDALVRLIDSFLQEPEDREEAAP